MYKTPVHISFLPKKLFLALAGCCLLLSGYGQDRLDSLNAPAAQDSVSNFTPIGLGDTPLVDKRKIADSLLQSIRADKDFWYANEAPARKKPVQVRRPFFIRPWFKTVLWALIICSFVAILIWYLIASDIRLFRSKASPFASDGQPGPEEDIFSIPYEKAIAQAIAEGDYRLAVRLHFLDSLRLLSEKKLIRFAADRTNSDYLMELHPTAYYKDFFRLARNFEYTWYGKFALPASLFEQVQQDFLHFKKSIRA